ncbi:MAG: hypothetical protein O2930_15110 [Acidobacteria bacterium]|nr:hypothetical protein [Acidobacteriota bacterium]
MSRLVTPLTNALPSWVTAQRATALAVFLYLTTVRTWGISDTFWLLGDQIRDWQLALLPFADLPLTGAPSSVGGVGLGPIYYWTLWACRVAIGPWVDYLPHAGGIGLSVIQSLADCVLLVAIWRKSGSGATAVALTLLLATSPLDMALSATIWNPILSVALVKLTLALLLLAPRRPSLGWGIGVTATGWLAVQAHATAMFVAVPAIGAFIIADLATRNWKGASQRASASIGVVLLLQVPFMLHLVLRESADAVSPTAVIGQVSATAVAPQTLRVVDAFAAVASATDFILLRPWTSAGTAVVLLVALVLAAYRCRNDVALASASVLPVVTATIGFSFWQLAYDQYWFLTQMPSIVLVFWCALTVQPRAVRLVGIALAIAVAVAQPGRIMDAHTLARLPAYGALVTGSTQIYRYTNEVTEIRTEFPLDPTTDQEFLFRILGGRVTPEARFRAAIAPDGSVTFAAVPQP